MERTPHAGQAGTVRSAPSRSEREGWRINQLFGIGKLFWGREPDVPAETEPQTAACFSTTTVSRMSAGS